MRKLALLPAAATLVLCSCGSSGSYPPPAQFAAAAPPDPPLLWVGYPSRGARILGEVLVDAASKGSAWTTQHPAFAFTLEKAEDLDLFVRFSVHSDTFLHTGPVTLTVRVNDELIDRPRFDSPGEREYSHLVTAQVLQRQNPAVVRLDVDPVWTAADGVKLGILLFAVGFERPGE